MCPPRLLSHGPGATLPLGDIGVKAALAPQLFAAWGCVSTEDRVSGGETRATNPVVNSCLHNSRLCCDGCECVVGWAIPCFPPCSSPVPWDPVAWPGLRHSLAQQPSRETPGSRQGAAGETQLMAGMGRCQRNVRSWVALGVSHGAPCPGASWTVRYEHGQLGSNRASQGSAPLGQVLGDSPGLAARASGAVPSDRDREAGRNVPGEG